MRCLWRGGLCVVLVCGLLGVGVSSAFAQAGSGLGWWHLTSGSAPTSLPAGGSGQLVLEAVNLGDADVSGGVSPVVLSDRLPGGVQATGVEGIAGQVDEGRAPVECVVEGAGSRVSCTFAGALSPMVAITVRVDVVVRGAVSGELNDVALSGGESSVCKLVSEPTSSCERFSTGPLAPASIARAVPVSSVPVGFGVENYELAPEEEGGSVDTQAGSHPFQLTTTLALDQASEANRPPALAKDLNFLLPPGLVGNPTVLPQCTDTQFLHVEGPVDECPADTALGVATITALVPNLNRTKPLVFVVPVFNLETEVGEPARFGFEFEDAEAYLDTSVRTGGDYGVTVSVSNIPQNVTFISSIVTIWGVPDAEVHDNSRGWGCIADENYLLHGHGAGARLPAACTALAEQHPAAFLALPTSCTGVLQSTVQADSWKEPGVFTSFPTSEPLPALDGCNRLPFGPSIDIAPDQQTASTPSGLTVKIHVPQAVDLDAGGLSTADVKDTTVTLPVGMQLSPSAAGGLLACSLEQVSLQSDTEAACPEASKVATVEVHSPLLANPLVGEMYLAAQEANPFGTLVAMYLVVRDPVSGVLVKLAGKVTLDPVTGQIVSTFEDTPQLPFEDLTVHFFDGERAPLTTPAHCGTYTTSTSIVPWSGNPPAEPSSSFEITSGPGASPCPES